MIKLKELILEKQALLTNNPVKLNFTDGWESTHIEIIKRLYPSEMENMTRHYEDMGYNEDGEEDEEDQSAAYKAANFIAANKKIARINIIGDILYFNTYNHIPLDPHQLSFIKNYCIENNLKLFHSISGRAEKEIDLMENKI